MARNIEVIDEITSDPITKAEIRGAIPSMSAEKAPGVAGIKEELLNAEMATAVDTLHDCFCEVWLCGSAPANLGKGVIVRNTRKGDIAKCGNCRGITLMSVVAKC